MTELNTVVGSIAGQALAPCGACGGFVSRVDGCAHWRPVGRLPTHKQRRSRADIDAEIARRVADQAAFIAEQAASS